MTLGSSSLSHPGEAEVSGKYRTNETRLPAKEPGSGTGTSLTFTLRSTSATCKLRPAGRARSVWQWDR